MLPALDSPEAWSWSELEFPSFSAQEGSPLAVPISQDLGVRAQGRMIRGAESHAKPGYNS